MQHGARPEQPFHMIKSFHSFHQSLLHVTTDQTYPILSTLLSYQAVLTTCKFSLLAPSSTLRISPPIPQHHPPPTLFPLQLPPQLNPSTAPSCPLAPRNVFAVNQAGRPTQLVVEGALPQSRDRDPPTVQVCSEQKKKRVQARTCHDVPCVPCPVSICRLSVPNS